VLPNGKGVLFTVLKASRRWDDAEIIVRSLVTSEQRVLVTGGADARYVPTGHVLYARMGTLMALPFDLARLQATGGPYGVVEGVAQSVNAACDDVPLTSEMRTALRERYDDCLCPACLRTAGESRATSSFPPASLPSTSSSAA